MKGKITLITPPDIFENDSYSILFIHLISDQDQLKVSEWLVKSSIEKDINIYFYDQEVELAWLFHAIARCNYTFIDVDNATETTNALSGYILGKKNTFYKTTNENKSAVYHHINQNRITNIELFLEKAFDVKN